MKSPSTRLKLPTLLPAQQSPPISPRTLFTPQIPQPIPATTPKFLSLFAPFMADIAAQRSARIPPNTQERYSSVPVYPSPHFGSQIFKNLIISSAPPTIEILMNTVLSEKITTILQLTPFTEQNLLKAQRWWPVAENEPSWVFTAAMQYEKVQQVISETNKPVFCVEGVKIEEGSVKWNKKSLSIGLESVTSNYNTNKEGEEFTCDIRVGEQKIQLMYLNWSDFSVISVEKMYELCVNLEQQKVLAHCSAGIGRAATFAACFEIYKEKRSGKSNQNWNLRIYEIVEEIRLKRSPLGVQSYEQYSFLFQFAKYVDSMNQVELDVEGGLV